LIKNGLGVGAELLRRRIKAGGVFPACGHEETMYHRFWGCFHSKLFWKELSSVLGVRAVIQPMSMSSQSSIASWLLKCFR